MFQNIKVDIIYYKANTDFELEFNLCGCCRMRLLTDKAADKKTLVHNLARAVSRSRVILIAGKLFGEDGIIEITARAIAKTLTEIDNKLYGISSENKISIINGATPLVTPDGCFGGCIIESGPQSMILLSDNKAVRKTVMNTLIHPYIEELCALDLKARAENTAAEASAQPAPFTAGVTGDAAAPAPDITDDVTDIFFGTETPAGESAAEHLPDAEVHADTDVQTDTTPEKSAEDTFPAPDSDSLSPAADPENDDRKEEEKKEEPEQKAEPDSRPLTSFSSKPDDVTLSGGMIFETDDYRISADDLTRSDKEPDLFIEPERLKKSRADYYNQRYALDANEDFVYHTGDDDLPERSKSGFPGNLPILIISVILLLILAILCYCIFYVPSKEGVTASAYLQETFRILFG